MRERQRRFRAGEDLSSSEDEDGNKKTGYELTDYMKEYNSNTREDFTEGYDPKSLDQNYKLSKHINTEKTSLPKHFDKTNSKSMKLDSEIIYELTQMLEKYQPSTLCGNKMNPKHLLQSFKKAEVDITNPSLYSMMEWICLANENSGTM